MTREEIWSNFAKLSELRSQYSCFDEKEEPFYHALSLGIKALEKESKTGHWIRKSYLIPIKTKEPPTVANGIFREVTTSCKYRYTYTCSKCGGNEYFEKYSYCPQCGAKMESEE